MPAAFLARVGLVVFAIVFGMLLLTERPVDGRALVAAASQSAADGRELAQIPQAAAEPTAVAAAEPVAAEPEPLAPEPELAPVVSAPASAVGGGDVVLASWYGPGFYGNRTACGLTFTPQILGVANKALPCGALVTLTFGARSVTVPVIDRGPYVAGRTLDLSAATKAALGCSDLCTVRMQLTR